MLYSLTINENLPRNLPERLINKLKFNYPSVRTYSYQNVRLTSVNYSQITKRISWDKISTALGAGRREILCDDNLELPKEFGFSKYNNRELMYRMAENAALKVLQESGCSPYKARVGIYDKECEKSDLAQAFLKYTSRLTVVTGNPDFYISEAARILYETGAPIFVTTNRRRLLDCDIIVIPEKLKEPIFCKSNSMIFTGSALQYRTDGLILHSARIKLPEEYNGLCPNEVNQDNFACALYHTEGVYELGSMIPGTLCSLIGEYSLERLTRYFKNIIES